MSNSKLNYLVEKETLALVLAIQDIEVDVGLATNPIVVYTDHNPLAKGLCDGV